MNKKIFFNFTIIILLIWPSYIALKVGNFPGIALDRLLIFGVLILFIISLVTKERSVRSLKEHMPIVNLLVAGSLWNVVTSFLAADNTLVSLFSSINWFLSGPFLALFVLMNYRNENDINKLIKSIFIALVIINMFGIIESVLNTLLFKNFIITDNEFIQTALTEKSRDGLYRIRSVFSNPLVYTQILLATIPILFYMLNLKHSKLLKIFIIINIILSYYLLYRTNSRMGFALMLSMPFFYYHIQFAKKRWYTYLFKILLLISLPVAIYYTYDGIKSTFDRVENLNDENIKYGLDDDTLSTLARVLQIKLGMDAIAKSPITGTGFGESVKAVEPLKAIDNYYLTITVSTGIVGLFLFIYMIYKVISIGLFNIKNYNDKLSIYLMLSIIILLLFYLILSIDKSNNLLFLIIAIIFVKSKLLRDNRTNLKIRSIK